MTTAKLYARANATLLIDNVPTQLKHTAQWDCWKIVEGAKIPINAQTNRAWPRGTSSELMAVSTFEEALKCFASNPKLTGVGFRFKRDDPFTGIDLDNVRDAATGKIVDWAADLVKQFATYAEASPSGTGIHVICQAQLEHAITKTSFETGDVEMYSDGRYFAITGFQEEGWQKEVVAAQRQVDAWFEFLTAAPHTKVNGEARRAKTKIDVDAPIGIRLPAGTDFDAALREKLWKFEKHSDANGVSYNYHGLNGQRCLLQGSVHADQARNPRQSRFLVKDGTIVHQCFDSDCRGDTGLKTRKALTALGLEELFENSPPKDISFRRDVANAALFARMHAGSVIWVADQELWYAWDGRRYAANNIGEVMRRARATVLAMYEEALVEIEESRRKAKMAWAIQSESRLEKMVAYARSEPVLEVMKFNDTFDTDPLLFNCANGTLDLRNSELYAHDQKHRITKLSPILYDKDARCEKFQAWLTATCNESAELVAYLMRFVGYCLSGLTDEQCFWLFYGPTKTGKSTFIRVIRGLLGEYATTLPEAAVIVNRFANQDYALAELAGVRLATLVEIRSGARYDEAKLKQITGQDRIGASKKYMNYFEFDSHAKLAMAVNDKPEVQETGDAFWNRVKPVPFKVFVPPEKRNPDLDKKFLNEEGPGMLALAAKSFREWRTSGMKEPEEVTGSTESYRSEQDIVSLFVEEECTVGKTESVRAGDLYKHFKSWVKQNDHQAQMTKVRFGKELTRLGYELFQAPSGARKRRGLALNSLAEEAEMYTGDTYSDSIVPDENN